MLRRNYMIAAGIVLSAVVSISGEQSAAQSGNINPLRLSPNHVTASVADLDSEANWYERVLGFQRSARLGGRKDFALYQMTMPGNRIDLVWQAGSARHQQAKGPFEQGWLHMVFNTPDLGAAYKYLVAKGTDVKMDRNAEGQVVHLTLHDPEGNEIGLVKE